MSTEIAERRTEHRKDESAWTDEYRDSVKMKMMMYLEESVCQDINLVLEQHAVPSGNNEKSALEARIKRLSTEEDRLYRERQILLDRLKEIEDEEARREGY